MILAMNGFGKNIAGREAFVTKRNSMATSANVDAIQKLGCLLSTSLSEGPFLCGKPLMYSVVLGLCFALASGACAQNVKVPKPKIYTPGEGDVLDNSSPLAHLPLPSRQRRSKM